MPFLTDLHLEPYPHTDDKTDRVKFMNAREQKCREIAIATARVKILREQVRDCYQREGVNHYEKCQEYTKAYYKIITTPGNGLLKPEAS